MDLALRESEVRQIVLDGARSLCRRGATVVGIACNTSQYYADDVAEVCEGFGARFVKTADETARYLRNAGIDTFDFLGIGAVADFAKWSGYGKALAGFDVRIPSADILPEIDELAHLVKQQVVSNTTRNKYRDLIGKRTQTQVVVLALTELSVLASEERGKQRPGKRIVDTLEVLAERMADVYIQEYVKVDRPFYSEENGNDADELQSPITTLSLSTELES
jgi:aspartate/glutamate racemase